MSFKMIGLAVFIAGVLGLAYLLFFTGKSEKKTGRRKGEPEANARRVVSH